ncbi:MAG: ABC transporter permease [Syntrophales bacterium]|nr:ABC transporter permease [Syntrophales bacterium]
MDYITNGFIEALRLLFSGDIEAYTVVFTTIKISSLSITASLVIGVPLGFLLGYYEFPGKRQIRTVVDTLLALPTVVVGLVVYAFVTRQGPLGGMGLLFTIPGIAVAQTILITPIVISLTATAVESLDRRLRETLMTLGARQGQLLLASIMEARHAIAAAAVTAYGRAISEVGISMMIGGNIKWYTRTITTAIALETAKGQFALGMALGIVLLTLALLVNIMLVALKKRS